MNIAFVVYNNMTMLDFVGVYDPLIRIKTMGFNSDFNWDICGFDKIITDNTGLEINPNKVAQSLDEYDMLVIPGGFGSRQLTRDEKFINWIKTSQKCKIKASVCTGSLILGAAGFLKEKCATTHPNAFKELEKYCLKVLNKRIVDEGNVITARGVTSSIDLGLYLCEKIMGSSIKEKIRLQMDYI